MGGTQLDIFDYLYETFKLDISKPIRLFEAFAGYGSQHMALKRLSKELGFELEVVGISEIDKYAIKSYEAIHGEVKNYGGIGDFDRFPKDIDICTWSFPCQDISLAGKQRGMSGGTRSNYGYVFLDTVENTPENERPQVLIMENVKALVSQVFEEDWREIQLRLEKMGYTNYAEVLNAKDYGVAQNRERVFVVSILGDYNYNFPKPFDLNKRLKDYLEMGVDEKYYLSDKVIYNTYTKYTGNYNRVEKLVSSVNQKDIARTITTKLDRPESQYITEPFEKEITEADIYNIKIDGETNKTITLNPKVDGKQPSLQDRIYSSEGISTAITTSYHPFITVPEATKQGYAFAEEGDGVYIDRNNERLRIRKLTPREAGRLMGVSEEDIDEILSVNSNTQAYKQFGNSIVVDVIYYIFRELLIKDADME